MNTQLSRVTVVCLIFVLGIALVPAAAWPVQAGPAMQQGTGRAPTWQWPAFDLLTADVATDPLGRIGVILRLQDPPLALYTGGIPGLAPTHPATAGTANLQLTSPAARAYARHLASTQAEFRTALESLVPTATVVHEYRVAFNGMALFIDRSAVPVLWSIPGVASVRPDRIRQPQTDVTPEFVGATAVWDGTAAGVTVGTKAEGIIVGVIDTGIWPEHPSFADDGSFPAPPGNWAANCIQPEDETPGYTCNNKLIGVQHFLDGYISSRGGVYDGLFISGRDDDGHGTHTASTAAGNKDVPATMLGIDRGLVSGMAPRAHVASYKACGPDGCNQSDLLAAINKAVADGVDAINYSIGGGGDNPWDDGDSLAFLAAREAGIFVATSAGNNGPGAGTIGSPADAPWIASVGMSTSNRFFISDITVDGPGDPPTGMWGASLTAGVDGFNLVDAEGIPDSEGDSSGMCLNPYTPGTFSAQDVVLCQRGEIARVARGDHVQAGGGGGVILYNPGPGESVDSDNYVIPAVHVDNATGLQLKDYVTQNPGHAIISFTQGTATLDEDPRVLADVMDSNSSRGPNSTVPQVIKPDLTAPGVQILAGASPEHTEPGAQGQLFQAIKGTSMSSPHVAGVGALLKAVHPSWSPAALQSALMTTAETQVFEEDGTTAADPFDMGGGRIDLTRAADPGLVFDITYAEYVSGQADPANINLASLGFGPVAHMATITRRAKSLSNQPSTWTVSVDPPEQVAVSVMPQVLPISAGGTGEFQVSVNVLGAADGWHFGSVTLSDGNGHTVRLPLAVNAANPLQNEIAKVVDPPIVAVGETVIYSATVLNDNLTPRDYDFFDTLTAGLSTPTNLTGGAVLRNGRVEADVSLPAGSAYYEFSTSGRPLPFGFIDLPEDLTSPVPPACDDLHCDDWVLVFTGLPDYVYDGNTYNTVGVSSNGFAVPGATAGSVPAMPFNLPIPLTIAPNNVVAPLWMDLDMDGTSPVDPGSGNVYVARVGGVLPDPSHVALMVQWREVQRKGAPGELFNFEVYIDETTGELWYVYETVDGSTDVATIGQENEDGTQGTQYYYNGDPAGHAPESGTELEGAIVVDPAVHTFTYQTSTLIADILDNQAGLCLDSTPFGSCPAPGLATARLFSCSACVGDIDGDGNRNILDVQRAVYAWGSAYGDSAYHGCADVDRNLQVGLMDVQAVASNWQVACVP